MNPASAAATSESLPDSNPLAAASLPAPSLVDPTAPSLDEGNPTAGTPADTSRDQFKPGSPSNLTSSKAGEQSVADNAAATPSDAAAVPAAGSPADAAAVPMRLVSAAAGSDALPVTDPLAATNFPPHRSSIPPRRPSMNSAVPPEDRPTLPGTSSNPLPRRPCHFEGACENPSPTPPPPTRADAAAVPTAAAPQTPAEITCDPPIPPRLPGSLPAAPRWPPLHLPTSSTPAPAAPTLEEPGHTSRNPADTSGDQFKPAPPSALTSSQSATNPGSGSAVADAPAAASVADSSRAEATSATMPGRALEASGSLAPGTSLVITTNASGSLPDPLLPAKLEAPAGALKDSAMAQIIRKQRGKPGMDTIREMGGSEGTEGSISSAIKWLVENQENDGRWDTLKHGARNQYDNGAAGLALLCFYGWGERHDTECKHRKNVRNALDWLLAQQDDDGYLGERANNVLPRHRHHRALRGLRDHQGQAAQEPAERAIAYTLAAQSPTTGGWRYAPGEDSDTSITGWQYMALHSARMAGLKVPEEAFERVRKLPRPHRRRQARRPLRLPGPIRQPVARAMVATGMFCRQLDLVPPSDPMMQESARWLKMRPMKSSTPGPLLRLLRHPRALSAPGPDLERMERTPQGNPAPAPAEDRRQDGSWEPSANITVEGGRVVSTALATLSLEVYYRLLPMYGFRNSEAEAPPKKPR